VVTESLPLSSPQPDDTRLKDRTQTISIIEGAFGGPSAVLADSYLVPFALAIGSSPVQIGLLSSVAGFISPLGQLIASHRMERYSRKRVLFTGLIGMILMWIPLITIAGLVWAFNPSGLMNTITWFTLFTIVLYYIFSGMLTPPWFSIMGDVVPENRRGRYFAKRNLILTAISMVTIFGLGLLLDWFKDDNQTIMGFLVLFCIGLGLRILSFVGFLKHYYPPYHFEKEDIIPYRQFIKELPRTNFGKFTLFIMFLYFGQWIAGPFFAVYMLQELAFTYTEYIMVVLSTSLFSLFVFPIVGKLADRFGNVRVMRSGAILIPILPVLWLATDSPLGLILLPQLLSGYAWTAFNLATSNFIYDNIPASRRAEYVAFYNFTVGFGVIFGGFVGSLLITMVTNVPVFSGINPYLFVFLISGIIRAIATAIYLPKIKEIRQIEAKPILNVKYGHGHRWLSDILLRGNHTKKSTKRPR
jgi:MFS family permease